MPRRTATAAIPSAIGLAVLSAALCGCNVLNKEAFLEPSTSEIVAKAYTNTILLETQEVSLLVYSPSKNVAGFMAPYPLPPFIPMPGSSRPEPLAAKHFGLYFAEVNGSLMLRPMRARLELPDGTLLSPAGFTLGCAVMCRNQQEDFRTDDLPIPLTKQTAVRLIFETEAGPGVTLRLLGIEREGRDLPLPHIRYRLVTGWHIGGVP
jgi:hypothetical protein